MALGSPPVPRDPDMPPDYWAEYVSYSEGILPQFEARVAEPTITREHRHQLRFSIYLKRLELLIARYSRGEPVASLGAHLPPLIDALAVYRQEEGAEPHDFEVMADYLDALWLVSLTLLLDADRRDLARLVALIDNTGDDALFDRLVAVAQPVRRPSRELRHPRPYEFLLRALDAEGTARDALLAEFLRRYRRGLRHTPWSSRYRRPEAGYVGLWAFELAACVRAFGLPDASFADHPFYPRDLARRPMSDVR